MYFINSGILVKMQLVSFYQMEDRLYDELHSIVSFLMQTNV